MSRLTKEESHRKELAEMRFYYWIPPSHARKTKWEHLVLDQEAEPKTIGKFSEKTFAKIFLNARREHFVKTGE